MKHGAADKRAVANGGVDDSTVERAESMGEELRDGDVLEESSEDPEGSGFWLRREGQSGSFWFFRGGAWREKVD